ncbi:biotin/lipoyl attachment [Nautilia profundicola AmH]|uniref:Biotin/lipoyl attachment n=1 Tax=Nautilia profundicola (strain ATCC BAA-1463 / DSM 18972 / AmH) TaxID=598659 RepID=B9L9W1_NAUPA|nr:biotin/lipoyl-containing protein [Nautilia profundicola]ACM93717.1 biotin/lipoyl attachment [Nautilia profundicola AmH]
MATKYIDVMDTTFRDGFQSVFGGRVLMKDFLPAVDAAVEAGIKHFEFGGGARFQSLFFYLQENAFDMMDEFAKRAKGANLQILARGINTVMLDTGSREMIDLFAKLFAKHNTTTVRNFDALNDVNNLIYSGQAIKNAGMKHEVVVTIMDLPPGCSGAHTVEFYEKILRDIIENVEFDSVAFKDATGTANPNKIYETVKMARKLLGRDVHIRLHTHETAGISVASYLAALEAGVDGIDLAAAPVSGGTSQPDIITLLHAVKGKPYNLGNLEIDKIVEYEETLKECLKDYFLPPEATQVNPIIPLSPMPGGALTANTQMMRDNNILHKFNDVIKAMREVVEKGGFGTSVTPVSQFYWQQAFNNVMFGPWKKIAPGYGKMVLGYFGKTPVKPDEEIIKLASEQLNLEPTNENPLDIADRDERKTIKYWQSLLEKEGIETTEENIFTAASCQEKGIAFLKGESPLMIRKKGEEMSKSNGVYTVIVDGEVFNVEVKEGKVEIKETKPVEKKPTTIEPTSDDVVEVESPVPGNVWKILVNPGDKVKAGDKLMIIESMKMEIDIPSPVNGIIAHIPVKVNDSINECDVLVTIEED